MKIERTWDAQEINVGEQATLNQYNFCFCYILNYTQISHRGLFKTIFIVLHYSFNY